MSVETVRKVRVLFEGLAACLILFVILILQGCSSSGHSSDAPELESSRQECLGVPDCVSKEGDLMKISGKGQIAFIDACPDNAKHVWNWDIDHSSDVSAAHVEEKVDSLLLRITNHSSDDGWFRIYLGCSTQPAKDNRTIVFRKVLSGSPE